MHTYKNILLAGTLTFSITAANAQDAVIYTSYPINEIEILQSAFKQQHNMTSSFVNGSSTVMLRRIEAESNKPAADVFWSSSASTVTPFKQHFISYATPALNQVPPQFHYQDHRFQPVNLAVLVFMVNESALDGQEPPGAWADLAKPHWRGKILMPNPESGSTGYSLVYGLSQMLDEATYKAVIGNMAVTESYRSLAPSVANGEYAITLVNEPAVMEYIAGGRDDIKIIYPRDGVFVNVEYAGVVNNGSNGEAGKKVIDTLLSKDVQIQMLQQSFRRPIRSDIKIADYLELPELSELKIFETDVLAAAAVRNEVLAAWRTLPKGH